MTFIKKASLSAFLLAALSVIILAVPTRAQEKSARPRTTPTPQTDDVLRINTELVQTDVMVFDKRGRFVDGLRPEQFELTLGGTAQPLSFFERVTAGSPDETAKLAAASRGAKGGAGSPSNAANVDTEKADVRGRIIFFFLDDVHLSGESLVRAREALRRFVDEQMNPNDQVAIVSTSGQIGFLQQLTDHPAVLRAAIARLNYRRNAEAYTGKTQISEYLASQIEDYSNKELFAYLMESTKLEQQMGSGSKRSGHKLPSTYSASPLLRNRIRQVNTQGRMATADTLGALQGLLAGAAQLPGRKLVFFLSDGFIINERKSGALEGLHSVAEAAGRAGAVVYTIDMRGTFFNLGSSTDASTNDYVDLSSRKAGLLSGEVAATQEPLKIMADETGGRAVFNSNAIGDAILEAVEETSDYYVLAWRPEGEEQLAGRARIKVVVKDRPDLRVRLRRSYYVAPQAAEQSVLGKKGAPAQEKEEAPEAGLVEALGSLYARRALPLSISVGYTQTPAGPALKISMQVERQSLGLDPLENSGKAELDVLGAAIDDRGQFKSFKQVLRVAPESSAQGSHGVIVWNQQLDVKPGLYQVRVAVRERAGGRAGSASQWVEIPEGAAGRLQLSSLFLGERVGEASVDAAGGAGPRPVTVDVDHRFSRSSVLRFQTYIYNATPGPEGPEVWIQTRVFRNRQQVVTVAPSRVPASADPARLPYWTEIALDKLPPGQYTLQVTATDRAGNANATQRVNFLVE